MVLTSKCKTLIIIHKYLILYISISIITTNMMLNNNADAEGVFEYTGKGCVVPKNVTIVRFHPSVIEVEYEAFRDCRQLREVAFNDGLKKIGQLAFYSCTSLESITFPSTLQEIGGSAFDNCNHLRQVVFNHGLQKIGRAAFYECKSLRSITFPSIVIELELGAFNSCRNLREVVLHGVPREIGQNAFSNCASLARFTFPTISTRLDTIVQTGYWEEIENEVDEVRGVVERRGGELFVLATQSLREGRNWNAVRRDLGKIIRLISYYELKEATSLLELALWKFKLDQVDKANPIPRKKCRMDVPGPVKDIILQYLSNECLLPDN